MLTNTAFAHHVRSPACARCGSTGYVFLRSIPRVEPRVWFCDRSTCKRFLLDARSIASKPAVKRRLCMTYGRSSRAPISECRSQCERLA